jgi:hypothetical protein
MASRRTTKQPRARPMSGVTPPPAPATEWGDEEEFKRFWGKSLEEIVEESRRDDARRQGEREIFWSDEEFLAALERDF